VDNGLFCSPKHPDTLEPILPSVLIGKTASFQRVKWWGFETNHPPPSSSTEVKNVWSYTSIPLYAFMVHRRLLPWHWQDMIVVYIFFRCVCDILCVYLALC